MGLYMDGPPKKDYLNGLQNGLSIGIWITCAPKREIPKKKGSMQAHTVGKNDNTIHVKPQRTGEN